MDKKNNNSTIDLSCFTSDNEILIISTLNHIKEKGSIDHLEDVINLTKKTKSEQVKKIALDILKNIKSSVIKEPLLNQLSKNEESDIVKDIVALCWEIKIDLADSLDPFCTLLLTADLETAIEAYTVITENIENLKSEDAEHYSKILYSGLENVNDERKGLIVECIKMIKGN